MKVRQVYDRAMALINERDSGGAYHSDTVDFEKNAPELVGSAVTLLWLDECVIRDVAVKDISWDFPPIRTMEDEIPLHEALATGVLPFALASFLLLEEDSGRSEHFYKLYVDARQRVVSSFVKAHHGRVQNIY